MIGPRQKAITDLALAEADRAQQRCSTTLSVGDMFRMARAGGRASRAVDAETAPRKARDDRAHALSSLQEMRRLVAEWLASAEPGTDRAEGLRLAANSILLHSRAVDTREVQPLDGLRKAEREYYAVVPRLSTRNGGLRERDNNDWCLFKHRLGDDLERMYDDDEQCKGCPDRAPCREAASK